MITHPEWWIVGMSHEDQLRLVKDYNVILERCYAQNMGGGKYKSNLADNLGDHKEVGYRNVSWSTPTADRRKIRTGNSHLRNTCSIWSITEFRKNMFTI